MIIGRNKKRNEGYIGVAIGFEVRLNGGVSG